MSDGVGDCYIVQSETGEIRAVINPGRPARRDGSEGREGIVVAMELANQLTAEAHGVTFSVYYSSTVRKSVLVHIGGVCVG